MIHTIHIFKKKMKKENTLFWTNLFAGLAHCISFVVMIILIGNKEWTIPIVSRYSVWKKTNLTNTGKCDDPGQLCSITSQTDTLFHLNVIWLVIISRMCSTAAHWFICLPFYFKKYYCHWLTIGYQPVRWVEYFFSASFMIVIITILTGYNDIETQVLCFAGIGVTMIFGLLMEQTNYLLDQNICENVQMLAKNDEVPIKLDNISSKLNFLNDNNNMNNSNDESTKILQQKENEVKTTCEEINKTYLKWCCFVFGWIPYMFVWGVLFSSFVKSIQKFNSGNEGDDVPSWVIAIFFSLFALFSCFAIVQLYQYKSKSANRFINAEYAYIALSFIAKSALAWQLWYGISSRNNNVEFSS